MCGEVIVPEDHLDVSFPTVHIKICLTTYVEKRI